jgi:hypothetical protein
MQFDEHEALIAAVRSEPTSEYWYPVLKHLVAIRDAQLCERLVREVLDVLSQDDGVHVLQVLEILAKSETLTLGTVRGFFLRHVEKLEDKARADEKLMGRLTQESAALQEDVDTKRTRPLVRFRRCQLGMAIYANGIKRYLDPPDIALDIMRLSGPCSQITRVSLSQFPTMMDHIQDLQNDRISIWTMPTVGRAVGRVCMSP